MKIEVNNPIIADEAFFGRSDIDELVITDSVNRLGNGAFRGCTNLKKVRFGNNVSSGGSFIFYDCRNISEVYVDDVYALFKFKHDNYGSPLQYGAKLYIDNVLCKTLHIPDDISDTFSLYAFIGCGSIDEVTVSKSNPRYQTLIEEIECYNSNLGSLAYFCDGVPRQVEVSVLD